MFQQSFFLKISLPLVSTFRKKWKTKIILHSKLIIFSHDEELVLLDYFKGTVMHIEKALINDRLRVSKVP